MLKLLHYSQRSSIGICGLTLSLGILLLLTFASKATGEEAEIAIEIKFIEGQEVVYDERKGHGFERALLWGLTLEDEQKLTEILRNRFAYCRIIENAGEEFLDCDVMVHRQSEEITLPQVMNFNLFDVLPEFNLAERNCGDSIYEVTIGPIRYECTDNAWPIRRFNISE